MLYLIVPPIIIVLAIIVLLWYLLRKASDPLVQERVHEIESHKKKHFRGLREWGLRFLEKFAQRSKNRSLKMHNALHNWLQSIRASRKKVAEEKKNEGEMYDEEVEEVGIKYSQPVEEVKGEEVLKQPVVVKESNGFSIPLIRRHKRDVEEKFIPDTKKAMKVSPVIERPMVSAEVALPDSRKRAGRNGSPEEDLIGKIATNPKDFEAYEALGDFYMQSGNIKDAKECYRQVLKLSPVQRMVKIKIRRLEKLLSQKSS